MTGEFWLAVALIGFLGLCVVAALVAFVVYCRRHASCRDDVDEPPKVPPRIS